jgi:hypothetical protein
MGRTTPVVAQPKRRSRRYPVRQALEKHADDLHRIYRSKEDGLRRSKDHVPHHKGAAARRRLFEALEAKAKFMVARYKMASAGEVDPSCWLCSKRKAGGAWDVKWKAVLRQVPCKHCAMYHDAKIGYKELRASMDAYRP